jgi:hypothetical protein
MATPDIAPDPLPLCLGFAVTLTLSGALLYADANFVTAQRTEEHEQD